MKNRIKNRRSRVSLLLLDYDRDNPTATKRNKKPEPIIK